jgi:hypothetical protein
MKHPVLDHAASLRRQADRFGFDCTATEWLGWDHEYAFRCIAGHEFLLTAQNLRMKQGGCQMCRGARSLRRLQEIAERNGLRCLSTEWVGAQVPYLFECSQGHRWHHGAQTMQLRCRQCADQVGASARRVSQGLQRLRHAAAARGGQCLSEAYTIGNARYRFRCAEGHEWEAQGHQMFSGTWCPTCAQVQRRIEHRPSAEGLARLQAAAHAKGGACLSDGYHGVGASYRFRCSAGHEWDAVGGPVLQGKWCKRCHDTPGATTRYRLQDGLVRLQTIAAERGGRCLSTEYRDVHQPVRMRCAKGHVWDVPARKLLYGQWCRLCQIDAKRLSIDHAHAAAAVRGGECLSKVYVNSHTKLTWLCDRGHQWQAVLTSVRHKGTWCPQCSSMDRISNRNSKARIKYQAVGQDAFVSARGSPLANAKPVVPGAGRPSPARLQGALKLTTRSGDTDARTPEEESSIT